MKKQVFTLLALAAGLLAGLTGCKKQWKGEHIVLNLADIHPYGYPTVVGCEEFSRTVYERSNGKIIINVQTDAPSELELAQSVRSGKLDFARISSALLADIDADFRTLNMPFLFRDSNHFWNVLNGSVGEKLLNGLWNYGFAGLCYYESGSRSFYTTKPIDSLEALRGLKIRVQANKVMFDFIRALGATPYPVEYADIYPAFANNAIQGAENNIPSYWSGRHYQLARCYYGDKHTRVPDLIIASRKTMLALSPEDATLIKRAAVDSAGVQRLAWEEYERAALRELEKAGVTIITPKIEAQTVNKIVQSLAAALEYRQVQIFDEIRRTR